MQGPILKRNKGALCSLDAIFFIVIIKQKLNACLCKSPSLHIKGSLTGNKVYECIFFISNLFCNNFKWW